MHSGGIAFFGIIRTPLVRKGADEWLVKRAEEHPLGLSHGHTSPNVHCEMLIQVAREYNGMDARTLTAHQIRFLYDGLRGELIKYSKGA